MSKKKFGSAPDIFIDGCGYAYFGEAYDATEFIKAVTFYRMGLCDEFLEYLDDDELRIRQMMLNKYPNIRDIEITRVEFRDDNPMDRRIALEKYRIKHNIIML